MNFHPSYRPDIDGLRAVAILLVIGFHAYPTSIPGGFVGVDVFFVISGYLISSIIFTSLKKGSFSFVEFYQKRINRIFPALIIVLFSVLVAGFVWLTPKELVELAQHVLGGAGFFSNILLWTEAGYFDAAAEAKPLLHLWSLGIEEQFYIIWPLLAFLAWRYARSALLALILCLVLISFGNNVFLIGKNAVATFYLPNTRFWELLIGACLAWLQCSGSKIDKDKSESMRSLIIANLKSCFGISLILWAAWALTKESAFPGWWALIPTVGSVLLISAGPYAWGNKIILGSKTFVLIGKISFPLYLWHWPLLTFSRLLDFDPASSTALSILLSFILSLLTYFYIEKPLRNGVRKGIAIKLSVGMILVAGSGAFAVQNNGIPTRFKNSEIFETISPIAWRQLHCFLDGNTDEDFSPICIDPEKERKVPLIVLWGDSHAAHLYPGFLELQRDGINIRLAQFSTSSCPPLLNFDSDARKFCRHLNQLVLEKIENIKPDIVVLAADWMDLSYDIDRLDDTVKQLKAQNINNIWLIGTVPRWPMPLPRYLLNIARKSQDHRILDRVLPLDTLHTDELLMKKASSLGIKFYSPKDAFCNQEGCLTNVTDQKGTKKIVNFDICHLTDDGSAHFARSFVDKLELPLLLNSKLD
jgi:peptidoglycan/LPS O-acetylase OafA/YrhL